ncbi:hypothetical protein EVAR_33458_1 [Eumeta japonica]|uniref:Uncharacterized protein n=1 Tax=Eumeta variegata TaxID=151549 RepID=A0A4C1WHW5_EUMVA|nr:hypothetical protein EVAR_33458_1 [Eumeta japonica]
MSALLLRYARNGTQTYMHPQQYTYLVAVVVVQDMDVADLMMELEGGHRNSVIKRRNPIEFGLVFNDAKEVNSSPETAVNLSSDMHCGRRGACRESSAPAEMRRLAARICAGHRRKLYQRKKCIYYV